MGKLEIELVKNIGENIGYGHLMYLASALWRKKLEETGVPVGGAFIPTCPSGVNDSELTEKAMKHYDKLVK